MNMNMEKIDKAYHRLKLSLKDHPDPLYEQKANALLINLHTKIDAWEPGSSIAFIEDFLAGDEVNRFAAAIAIQPRTIVPNFLNFIQRDDTKEILAKLFLVRKQNYAVLNFALAGTIRRLGLLDHLAMYGQSPRPTMYTQRLELLIFPELFTSTADSTRLKEIGEELNIPHVKDKTFEVLQFSIREQVNMYLKEKQLMDKETTFFQSAIAWHITGSNR
jgi:hypothetical protein